MTSKTYASHNQDTTEYGSPSWRLCETNDQFFEHPDGYFLPIELTHALHCRIVQHLPKMLPDASYTFKELCGKFFWKALSKQQRHVAYNCVSFLIDNEDLPLDLIGFAGKKGYLFALKQ